MPSPSSSLPPRTVRQLLLDRDFGLLFWGKLGYIIAVWGFFASSVTLTFQMTGSPSWVGIVGAANMVPQLGLALPAGRLSDSRGPHLPIVIGVVMSGIASAALGLWTVSVNETTHQGAPWQLVLCSLAFGSGLALSGPGMHSATPRLVRPNELAIAVAVNFFPTALGRAIGPALGAGMAATVGHATTLCALGLVSFAAGITFAFVRIPPDEDHGTDVRIVSALRYVRRDPQVLALLSGVAALAIGAEPALTLAPVLAEAVEPGGQGTGTVLAAFGIGGIAGLFAHRLAIGRISSWREGLGAMCALAIAMFASALAENMVVLVVAMTMAGMATMVGMTALSVAVQQVTTPAMRGRVMGLWLLFWAGGRPMGAFVQGLSTEHFGVAATLFATAASLAALTAWIARVLMRS